MQDQIINEAVKLYREHYPGKPTYCVVAPGRVNLIGEHTDYNEGFVCPLGINLATCIVGIKGEGNVRQLPVILVLSRISLSSSALSPPAPAEEATSPSSVATLPSPPRRPSSGSTTSRYFSKQRSHASREW